jgi:two-component system sensor histidine kinase KdpD
MNSNDMNSRPVDRLMVAVGPGPGFETMVRLGRRTAVELSAPWLAVYVDTGRVLDDTERRQLACNLDLARALGAEVISTAGVDLAETLLRVAREKSVTRMIAGKPQHIVWWRGRGVRTPIDRLIRQSGEIEIDLVQRELPTVTRLPVLRWPAGGWRQTVWALFILAVVTFVGGGVERTLGYPSVPLIYVVILIMASLFLSRWTVMLLAFGSALTWWFFYLPKQWSLRINRTEDALMLGLFFVAAMACGHIASRLRARERGGIEGERNARTLYDLLRGLNESRDLEGEGLESAVEKVEIAFRARVALLRPVSGDGVLVPYPAGHLAVAGKEMAAAVWALQNRQWAGRETGNFPDAEATCVPLISGDRVCGVLVVQAAGETWQALQRELMESIARLVADMMVREETANLARDAQVAVKSQKMQRALVDNFSHEMQTPLSVVASAIQHLRRQGWPALEQDVLREASIAVARLSLVVNEMVGLARLDGRHAPPRTGVVRCRRFPAGMA